MSTEEKNQDPETISENPVNVLFNTSSIAKKDVWEIDIVGILEMLLRILGKSGKKDLRVAGMAALSSSLIYRMKVESIFALHRTNTGKKILTHCIARQWKKNPHASDLMWTFRFLEYHTGTSQRIQLPLMSFWGC